MEERTQRRTHRDRSASEHRLATIVAAVALACAVVALGFFVWSLVDRQGVRWERWGLPMSMTSGVLVASSVAMRLMAGSTQRRRTR